MTVQVTMLQTRMGEAGTLLVAGTSYTVTKAFGAFLVANKFATDPMNTLKPDSSDPAQWAFNTWEDPVGLKHPATGSTVGLPIVSSGYHFHGFAPNQINSDLKFYDYSGTLNDAAFQANLSASTAWGTAGFLSQTDPVTTSNLQLVSIPALTWDWANGDSLFLFWRGMATPEGSAAPIMGNTSGTSANGLKLMVSTSGKLNVNVYQASGALSRFGGTSTSTVFEASTAHSLAIAIDGVTGNHCYWSDGVRDATFNSGFATFSGGGIIDALSATTFKLGGDGSTTSSIQNGVACKTQALVILSGRRGRGTPVVADMDIMVANLHRNPQALVLQSAW